MSFEWNGNTLLEGLLALALTAGTLAFLWYVRCCGLNKLKGLTERIHAKWVRRLIETLQSTKLLPLLIIAIYTGTQILALPPNLSKIIHSAFVISLLLQAGLWVSSYLSAWTTDYREQQVKKNPSAATTIGAIRMMIQMGIWVAILLLIMDNLGFNVTTLLTGLGIGGVAVALAVQNILGDIFASLSIVIDKTFVIGDYLTVGDLSGNVEYIGLKNTRIRSLSGEQIILSNTDLLGSRIRNYGRMLERRTQAQFSVPHQTSREKLESISGIIRQVVESHDKTRFDYAHITTFVESGLNVEFAYYILSREYNFYLATNEKIIFEILDLFARDAIHFAYPSRVVRMSEESPWVMPEMRQSEQRMAEA
jgi:small-conductance mechanosensitive channel